MKLDHRSVRGRIAYTSTRPELEGQLRGAETFDVTVHGDGSRVLRSFCAIFENSPKVLRDSVVTLNADWLPTEAYARAVVDDAFIGSCWYRFTPTRAECEGYTVKEGRLSIGLDLERPVRVFGTHPMHGDAWLTKIYDLSKGPGVQHLDDFYISAGHNRGADGPTLLHKPKGMAVRYFGVETVTVPAGQFETHHFQLGEETDDSYMGLDKHPPYHMWVTTDGDYTFVKASVTGWYASNYELVEYQKGEGFL